MNSFRSALDLCVCVSPSLSPDCLIFETTTPPPATSFPHPLPPLHQLQSRSK